MPRKDTFVSNHPGSSSVLLMRCVFFYILTTWDYYWSLNCGFIIVAHGPKLFHLYSQNFLEVKSIYESIFIVSLLYML